MNLFPLSYKKRYSQSLSCSILRTRRELSFQKILCSTRAWSFLNQLLSLLNGVQSVFPVFVQEIDFREPGDVEISIVVVNHKLRICEKSEVVSVQSQVAWRFCNSILHQRSEFLSDGFHLLFCITSICQEELLSVFGMFEEID